MIPGVDSYCYHRQFGDPYAGLQHPAEDRLTIWQALDEAAKTGAQGISLETCYMPLHESSFLPTLRDALQQKGFQQIVWAWGHPDGLASGSNPAALDDLIAALQQARTVGANVMRICAGSRRTRPATWQQHRAALLPMLQRAAAAGEQAGVVVAVENHIDLLADELAELIGAVDSPFLGVCFDTANQLRMLEDPMLAAAKLAPLARATHVKNVVAHRGDPRGFAFWPSVRLQDGLVDIPAILHMLRDAGYAGLLAVEIDYLHPNDNGGEINAVRDSLHWLKAQLSSTPPQAA